MNQPRRRRCAPFVIVACSLLLFPAVQIVLIRFVNPPTTTPMMLRWCEDRFSRTPCQPNSFHWLAMKNVPLSFLSFVWLSEDRHFFVHSGFDWQEIQNARKEAQRTGAPARGASTITQQCARSLFLWQRRSWFRKGLEAYYTVWMELLLSKKRILELYVNVAEFGKGVYGLEAAAEHYYGVSAESLTDKQLAMLVAILPNPENWNPNQPSDKMLRHQATILERSQNYTLPAEKLE